MQRRHFVGGVASAVGALALAPRLSAHAIERVEQQGDQYDAYAKRVKKMLP